MNRNVVLLVVIGIVIILLITGTSGALFGTLQTWLNAEHSFSGLVLVIGALVLVIGTKVLWR